jgi:hypothetical protein
MRYLRYVGSALLAFIFGVAISPIHFEAQGWGCGKVIDGDGWFSVTSFRSSYFVYAAFAHEPYSSADKANQVFDERLKELTKIAELTPKIDKQGMIVGRRAVGTLLNDKGVAIAVVFWTDGRMLHFIYSKSWLHAVELERASSRWTRL